MRYIIIILLSVVFTGCTTSRVYNRKLSEVSDAIGSLQSQMVAEILPECQKVGASTNQTPGKVYSFCVQDTYRSGPFPYLIVQATSQGADKTKIVVTRVAVTKDASLGVTRRRDLERQTLNVLTIKLANKP